MQLRMLGDVRNRTYEDVCLQKNNPRLEVYCFCITTQSGVCYYPMYSQQAECFSWLESSIILAFCHKSKHCSKGLRISLLKNLYLADAKECFLCSSLEGVI